MPVATEGGVQFRSWLTLLLMAALAFALWFGHSGARAALSDGNARIATSYWVDENGEADIRHVESLPGSALKPLLAPEPFQLPDGALWLRLDLPAFDTSTRWYLQLDATAFIRQAALYLKDPGTGQWVRQQAGAQLAVSQWSHPDKSPLFEISQAGQAQVGWLRLGNYPTAINPDFTLIDEVSLGESRAWNLLLVGAYTGFGLLVLFLGWTHLRLYGDKVFLAYMGYVAFMMGFQLSFTGVGGQYLWPNSAWWTSASPAIFMLWMSASGIWFVREVCAVSRYHRLLDRFALGWSLFGFVLPAVYLSATNTFTLMVLNLYGLISVLLSIFLCLWTWRQGERYAGWMFLGFLPVHLGYPFPALRAAGVLADSWATQYAVLIGSAIEIPLLLYFLHRRAKEFNENSSRYRALDTSDVLTGLPILPVMRLRLRDAVRRAKRYGHHFGLLVVDFSNYQDTVDSMGRESGERALVVAATRLSRLVREVDTVCRISDARFVILVEGPQQQAELKLLAQHIVARGLETASTLPRNLTMRFRVVTALLPHASLDGIEDVDGEDMRLIERLGKEFGNMAEGSGRVVIHLPRKIPLPTSPEGRVPGEPVS
ncbi:7TM diverse intracellular signaling domain-containing protein [Hydrogenophaga sp. 5NK40-0174]|uniref:sensor domain-containing diguanylate cyclase n=1 Tax=Hydrogenophaga sp. 5NK40-0174 TaxID=3127649 RepID=UPI003103AA2B